MTAAYLVLAGWLLGAGLLVLAACRGLQRDRERMFGPAAGRACAVRHTSPGGRINGGRRHAPAGPQLAAGAGGNVPAPAASQRVVVRG